MSSLDRVRQPIRSKRRNRDLARTPKLGPLPLLGSGAVLVAILGAAGLYLFLAWLLGVDPHLPPPGGNRPRLPIADQQKLLADLVKIALGLAAGIGAAFALVVGYRRTRVEEAGSHRDDRRLFSSRYQDAASLIGSDKPAVRLAGIYAMARLADDWEEQQQQCIDVLCGYLRLPYDLNASKTPRPRASRLNSHRVPPAPQQQTSGEREVRLTVIRLITEHLQPGAMHPWHGRRFDFTGAVFDGGDFRGAQFSGGMVNFSGARFSSGIVDFRDVQFSGSTVEFLDAEFSGSTIYFSGAQFSGGIVDFLCAHFSGGTVDFADTQVSGGDYYDEHASSCTVHFTSADFSGGTVNFHRAQFSGGRVDFRYAQFAGGIVDFRDAQFSGSRVWLQHAQFSGGRVDFRGAQFSRGSVEFNAAEFSGGDVDLSAATLGPDGTAPLGLPETQVVNLKLPSWTTQSSEA